jgi:hypothetical protein
MRSFGGFLALAGVLSIALYFAHYNLRILMWIDRWGSGVGWGIRIGLVVLGAILLLAGGRKKA